MRLIDLLAVLAVAVVLLLPKPSVDAQPALVGDAMGLDRLAEAQSRHFKAPDDVEPALELADGFLSFDRADWAIATLARFATRPDYRVHLLLATAHAERLEAADVVRESDEVERLCNAASAQPACRPGTLAREGLIRRSMQVLLEQGIDPAKDPVKARAEVAKVLRTTKYGGAPK